MPVQRYVSDEHTHFVGRALGGDEARYGLLRKILREGLMTHPSHDPRIVVSIHRNAKISENEMYDPKVVCFCDIPVEDLAIHSKKYGKFGLSFKKSTLVKKGANPVFYIVKGSIVFPSALKQDTRSDLFDKMVPLYHREVEDRLPEMLAAYLESHPAERRSDPIKLSGEIGGFLNADVFAFLKFFDETKADDDPDNFYMEREWRVLQNVQFSLEDVSRVIYRRSLPGGSAPMWQITITK
jgi:hypothetical protein